MERFRIQVSDKVLDDLRVRLRRTRWPDQVPGVGWVAWYLYIIDDMVQRQHYVFDRITELPSFYWRRQCYTTFMDDPAAIKLLDDIGEDNVMWSIDYPHAESVLGREKELMRGYFDKLGDRKAKKIVGGNAARVWGL